MGQGSPSETSSTQRCVASGVGLPIGHSGLNSLGREALAREIFPSNSIHRRARIVDFVLLRRHRAQSVAVVSSTGANLPLLSCVDADSYDAWFNKTACVPWVGTILEAEVGPDLPVTCVAGYTGS